MRPIKASLTRVYRAVGMTSFLIHALIDDDLSHAVVEMLTRLNVFSLLRLTAGQWPARADTIESPGSAERLQGPDETIGSR